MCVCVCAPACLSVCLPNSRRLAGDSGAEAGLDSRRRQNSGLPILVQDSGQPILIQYSGLSILIRGAGQSILGSNQDSGQPVLIVERRQAWTACAAKIQVCLY